MDFSKGLKKAYETNWSYVNTFTVTLNFATDVAGYIGWAPSDNLNINLNIISIDTPQLTNQQIEAYIGDRWKIHNGRDELYLFSITFRDQDQLNLYRKFSKAYFFQKSQYFDDIKMSIRLEKDADYSNEKGAKTIYNFEDVMINSVSQIQLSNTTENQIAEFSVDFKCAYPLMEIDTSTGRDF